MIKYEDLKLGCDPELAVAKGGVEYRAGLLFNFEDSVGTDRVSQIAEIRPGVSKDPLILVTKIRKLLSIAKEYTPADITFYAGHFPLRCPIGGHIHFNVPLLDADDSGSRLIETIDTIHWSFSNIVDDVSQRARRMETGYGHRKSVRHKEHGFEYRTPGSWLLSPSIALVELTLMKVAYLLWSQGANIKAIKGRLRDQTFLLSLKNEIDIPDDCYEGLMELPLLIKYRDKIDWRESILENWT